MDLDKLKGIGYLSLVLIFVLILRHYTGKSEAGRTMLKINDGIQFIKFIPFIIILIFIVVFYLYNTFSSNNSNDSKKDKKNKSK